MNSLAREPVTATKMLLQRLVTICFRNESLIAVFPHLVSISSHWIYYSRAYSLRTAIGTAYLPRATVACVSFWVGEKTLQKELKDLEGMPEHGGQGKYCPL